MDKPIAIRSIVDTLREIRSGQCIDELSVKLNDLVAAVRATGKGGDISLKIKVSPAGNGAVYVVQLEDKISINLPELPKPSTLFFPTEDNNLQRTDPRQRSMELGVMEGGKKSEAAIAS